MMKIAVTLVAVVIPSFCYANRSLEFSTLDGLVALDEAPPALDGVKTAITTFNERALDYMPTAATLRAEDTIATACLHVSR